MAERWDGELSAKTSEQAELVIEQFHAANGVTAGSVWHAFAEWLDARTERYGWEVEGWPDDEVKSFMTWCMGRARMIDGEIRREVVARLGGTPVDDA